MLYRLFPRFQVRFLYYILAIIALPNLFHLLDTPPPSYLLEDFGSLFSHFIASIVSQCEARFAAIWKIIRIILVESLFIREHALYTVLPNQTSNIPTQASTSFSIPFITQVLDVSCNHGDLDSKRRESERTEMYI